MEYLTSPYHDTDLGDATINPEKDWILPVTHKNITHRIGTKHHY